MPSIQAAPAQTYPLGETDIPSSSGASFAQRTINQGSCSIPASGFVDPDTKIEVWIDFQLPDGSWWNGAVGITQKGSPGGWATKSGSTTTLVFEGVWPGGVTVRGARMRIVVEDAAAGSGLAQPVSLGAVTLTWS